MGNDIALPVLWLDIDGRQLGRDLAAFSPTQRALRGIHQAYWKAGGRGTVISVALREFRPHAVLTLDQWMTAAVLRASGFLDRGEGYARVTIDVAQPLEQCR